MTTTQTEVAYSRCEHVVWRDTGLSILTLSVIHGGEVLVLGGGNATIWRLMSRPCTLADLTGALGIGDSTSAARELIAALDELSTLGLIDKQAD